MGTWIYFVSAVGPKNNFLKNVTTISTRKKLHLIYIQPMVSFLCDTLSNPYPFLQVLLQKACENERKS